MKLFLKLIYTATPVLSFSFFLFQLFKKKRHSTITINRIQLIN